MSSIMWHEARKHEKKLRGMIVDHKKRAERRREYYEKIKLDPTQFIQLHGRRCKIHLDPAVAAAAEAPATMMPWQGQKDNLIDRFDGRAHLDYLPEIQRISSEENLSYDELKELRHSNYERYRILVQNDFLKIPEEKFLRTIELEEQFGGKTYQQQKSKDDKKKSEKGKAAIGFVYEDTTTIPEEPAEEPQDESESSSDSDSEMDLDLTVDIMALSTEAQNEINLVGRGYNLGKQDFIKFLARDIEEAQEMRIAKEQEEEKAMFSGRKSRRERRLLREKRLMGRKLSPPSYAARESPSYDDYRSKSSSRSPSPANQGKVEFITSFGVESEDDDNKRNVAGPIQKPSSKINLKKLRDEQRSEDATSGRKKDSVVVMGPCLPDDRKSRRKSRSRSREYRRKSRSPKNRDRDRGRSSSDDRSRNRRGSTSKNNKRKRSRTHSLKSRNRSRSRSPEKPKRKRRSSSSSSSSSSDNHDTNPNRYRSKYRNRRKSSSSSDAKKRSSDSSPEIREKPLFKSLEIVQDDRAAKSPSPKPVKRYYGRTMKKSESELSDSDLETDKTGSHNRSNRASHNEKPNNSAPKVVDLVKDKIRKRMQAQIRKQFKLDKKAEEEKRQREEEERLFREEELRELASKLRRRGKWAGSDHSSRSRSTSPEDSKSGKNGNGKSKHSNRSPSPVPARGDDKSSSSPTTVAKSRRRSRSRSKERERRKKSRWSRSRSRSCSPPRKAKLVDY